MRIAGRAAIGKVAGHGGNRWAATLRFPAAKSILTARTITLGDQPAQHDYERPGPHCTKFSRLHSRPNVERSATPVTAARGSGQREMCAG